jgi:hypothetical protein
MCSTSAITRRSSVRASAPSAGAEGACQISFRFRCRFTVKADPATAQSRGWFGFIVNSMGLKFKAKVLTSCIKSQTKLLRKFQSNSSWDF